MGEGVAGRSRRIVAWAGVSLDGYTSGPNGPAGDTWLHEQAAQRPVSPRRRTVWSVCTSPVRDHRRGITVSGALRRLRHGSSGSARRKQRFRHYCWSAVWVSSRRYSARAVKTWNTNRSPGGADRLVRRAEPDAGTVQLADEAGQVGQGKEDLYGSECLLAPGSQPPVRSYSLYGCAYSQSLCRGLPLSAVREEDRCEQADRTAEDASSRGQGTLLGLRQDRAHSRCGTAGSLFERQSQ